MQYMSQEYKDANIFVKFFLIFTKKQHHYKLGSNDNYTTVYKMFRNKIYILGKEKLNCY